MTVVVFVFILPRVIAVEKLSDHITMQALCEYFQDESVGPAQCRHLQSRALLRKYASSSEIQVYTCGIYSSLRIGKVHVNCMPTTAIILQGNKWTASSHCCMFRVKFDAMIRAPRHIHIALYAADSALLTILTIPAQTLWATVGLCSRFPRPSILCLAP